MTTEEVFEIGADGSFHGEIVQTVQSPARSSPRIHHDGVQGLARIHEMIVDEETPVADITRLIALEIVATMQLMVATDPLAESYVSQKDLNDRVKGYRELQKTLTEGENLSKRDILNLDGEKFRYFFTEMIKLLRQALTDAKLETSLVHNIMLQFGDAVKANDQSLRRELNKLGNGR